MFPFMTVALVMVSSHKENRIEDHRPFSNLMEKSRVGHSVELVCSFKNIINDSSSFCNSWSRLSTGLN